jgi:hypothetical protein
MQIVPLSKDNFSEWMSFLSWKSKFQFGHLTAAEMEEGLDSAPPESTSSAKKVYKAKRR